MSTLFQPLNAGKLRLANRIVMAPLTRNRSPNAVPPPLTATYYAQRASAGLIITEATAISHQGQGYADVPGLYAPEQLAGWRRVTDAVHAAGGTIVVQLWHVGRISHTTLQPGQGAPVAPSAIRAQARTYLVDAQGKGRFADTSGPARWRWTSCRASWRTTGAPRGPRSTMVSTGSSCMPPMATCWTSSCARAATIATTRTAARSRTGRGCCCGRSMRSAPRSAPIASASGSPVTPANDAHDDQPQPLFEYVLRELARRGLAYVHVIEGATGGDRAYQQGPAPFDYAALKAAYRAAGGAGAWMVNNGYDISLAEQKLSSGQADLVAFGKPFIANPDLVARLRQGAALNEGDRDTFYGGGERGYTDYPALA